MNTNRIPNLDAEGEGAHITAQSAYSSCHNTIRTQILKFGQSRGNRKLEPWSGFNLAKKRSVYVRTGKQPCQDKAGQVAWRFLTRTRAYGSLPIRTEAGYPGTIANTTTRSTAHYGCENLMELDNGVE